MTSSGKKNGQPVEITGEGRRRSGREPAPACASQRADKLIECGPKTSTPHDIAARCGAISEKMPDYYAILWRALRKGDFQSARWRESVFEQTRQMLRRSCAYDSRRCPTPKSGTTPKRWNRPSKPSDPSSAQNAAAAECAAPTDVARPYQDRRNPIGSVASRSFPLSSR